MFSKNELDNAHKAVQLFMGDTVQIGNPTRFIRGYDTYTGGNAAIANFNNLMAGVSTFAITGIFGRPGVTALNLTSQFPRKNAQWIASSFVTLGGGLQQRWRGTAVSFNDVQIIITTATGDFTGTLSGYGTITGNALFNAGTGVWRINNATLTISTFYKNIFYGKIGWGMTNDNNGVTNQQILVNAYDDLIGASYAVTLNITFTLGAIPLVIFDSEQGEINGLASSIYMAGKNNIFFDGVIFPLRAI